jgi:transcriptional regulator GlxA family with amidase domain
MHRVAVLALDGVYPFDLGIPSRVLANARTPSGEPRYEVRTCSADGGPVRTAADFSLSVDHGPELLATADTVIVPSCSPPGEWVPGPVEGVFEHVRPGTRLVSICTGSYVLAAAGLLDGRPATTHWRLADHFQRSFPEVRVDPDVLFVDDGDVLTSAGAASGIDLCLHLIRRDHGSEVANQAARACVVPPWRDGGQAQYIEHPVPEPAAASTSATRAWALEHLDRPLPLAELAAHARMSVRTFTRRFRDETGHSPSAWLSRQRLELARRLLETTDLPVDAVARRAGFGTAVSLRQHLHAAIGVSPLAYRRTFRTTADGAAVAGAAPS